MGLKNYTTPLPNGTLVRLYIGKGCRTEATSHMTFKQVSLPNGEIGMIVASKIWPDQNWPRREKFQEHAPFYKVLFGHDVVLISENNLPSTVIRIVKEGDREGS